MTQLLVETAWFIPCYPLIGMVLSIAWFPAINPPHRTATRWLSQCHHHLFGSAAWCARPANLAASAVDRTDFSLDSGRRT